MGYTIAIGLLMVLVQVGHASLPPNLFPSIPQILSASVRVLVVDYDDLLISLGRLLGAVLTATIVGWFFGLLMGAFRNTFNLTALPTLTIMQAIPALSWVLVASLWILNVEIRVWFICFTIGMPLYAIAVYEGIRDLDPDLIEAVEQFRPSKLQVISTLLLPQSLVYVLMSMRSVPSLILRILVFAELIGASSGVGARMADAQNNFDIATIFAWTVIMVIINFVIIWGIDTAERKLLVWRREVTVR